MTAKKIEDLLKEKKIYQIINPRVIQAKPTISLGDAIDTMKKEKAGYILLTDNSQLVGIFTETDVAIKILGKETDFTKPIKDFMTPNPHVLKPTDSVGSAIDLMAKKTIYHLPLVDETNDLVGMLSVRTLIRFLAEFYPTEVYNLPPDPEQVSTTQEGG